MVTDTTVLIHQLLKSGKRILIEGIPPPLTHTPEAAPTTHSHSKRCQQHASLPGAGANATMLDLDFGTYPYVTSSR